MGCNKAGLIIRGTTPTIVMTYKTIDVSDIVEAYLTIRQSANKVEINKTIANADIGEKTLSWKLTQEDTLQIDGRYSVEIQCRYLLNDGTAGSSAVYDIPAYKILRDGVIE